MADESTSYSDLISRRRFVELTGVTGAAALAGCGGDGDGTDTPTDGEGGTDTPTPEPITSTTNVADDYFPDQRHIGVTTVNPADLQFNPWNSTGAPAISDRLLFEKFAQYKYAQGEFGPAAMTDWGLNDGTFTMTLRDGLTWSNGESITAEDIVRQLKIAEFDEDPITNWAENISAPDESTVEIEVADDVNEVLIEADLFTQRMVKADGETYGQWLTDLQNGDSSIEDLRGFVDDDPVTSGPFTFESKNDQVLNTTNVRDVDGADSPWSENINFGQYAFEAGGNNQQRRAALNNLEVDSDFSLAVSARVLAGFPDAIEEVNYPDVWGFGIYPNHNHAHAGDRAVRQAIAYAINRQQCVNNSLPRAKRAPQFPIGISDVAGNQSNWLGDAASDFDTYGKAETNATRVQEVMEGAGYSLVNDQWQDSDGNTVSLPVTCPSGWGDWVDQAETIVANLQSVGFQSSFDGMTGFLDSENPMKSGDFVLAAGPWLHGGPLNHPYFSLTHQLQNQQVSNQEVQASYPSWTEEWGGSRADITVPARGGDGELTLNPIEELNAIASTSDTETINTKIRDLAWVANVDLPTIPIADKIFQSWLTSDDWTTPENLNQYVEAQVQFAPTWLPRQGLMNYKSGDN